MASFDLDSADGIQQVSIVSVSSGIEDFETFIVNADNIAIGNGKSMVSVVNDTGSGKIIKLRSLFIVNVQNASVTGVIADFGIHRCTGHSVGTSLTPRPFDTADSLHSSVTARTGATIAGESAYELFHWNWSSDDWSGGAPDTESADHAIQTVNNLLQKQPGCKPITLRAGEGFTLKQHTNSTAGMFDILLVFTQENAA